ALPMAAAARIGDLPDGQVGVADAALDRLVLLPEPAFELQADFDGGRIGHGVDGRLHPRADVDLDLTQNRKRDRAYAPFGRRNLRRGWRFGVHVADRDAAIALLNADHLGVVLNEIAALLSERLPAQVHAADRRRHGAIEVMQG